MAEVQLDRLSFRNGASLRLFMTHTEASWITLFVTYLKAQVLFHFQGGILVSVYVEPNKCKRLAFLHVSV